MKASCMRLKLVEVTSLQVSILTIKVFLTYLTYFNQKYFLHSNILSTQYIPTPVHTLNTTCKIIYLNTLWVGFMFTIPILLPNSHFPLSQKLHRNTIQTIPLLHIILMGSKLFPSLKYTFHSKYSKTSPSTEDQLSTEAFTSMGTYSKQDMKCNLPVYQCKPPLYCKPVHYKL